eukprot:SAG31_NODE_2903_length_4928_cov_6.524746_3_plen_67_part_00
MAPICCKQPQLMDHCAAVLAVALFALSCVVLVDLDEAGAWWARVSRSELDRLRLSLALLLRGEDGW